ncbi:hypothetical protein C0Z17_01345 [Trinickia caryophylli]|nr:hypothetical protein C0Z17_01345 [Trinickia caryophylli]
MPAFFLYAEMRMASESNRQDDPLLAFYIRLEWHAVSHDRRRLPINTTNARRTSPHARFIEKSRAPAAARASLSIRSRFARACIGAGMHATAVFTMFAE